jgi:hypothetical protein
MMATDDKPRRWEAATGIAFVVFVLGGLIMQGNPPKADDSIDEIRSFFNHRGAILAGDYLIGMGWAFFLWFLGSVRFYLRAGAGGDDRFWTATFGGALAGTVLVLASTAGLNGIAFQVAPVADPVLLRALFDLDNALLILAGFGFAVFFVAAACSGARSGALGPAMCWSGIVVALIQVVGAAQLFARSGFFQVAGPLAFAAILSASLWTLALSIAIIRAGGLPPRSRTQS